MTSHCCSLDNSIDIRHSKPLAVAYIKEIFYIAMLHDAQTDTQSAVTEFWIQCYDVCAVLPDYIANIVIS